MIKYAVLEKDSYTMTCCRNDKVSICTLPHENSFSIKEMMINFLIHVCSVQISRDFPPCYHMDDFINHFMGPDQRKVTSTGYDVYR